jgi:hypothetical protein
LSRLARSGTTIDAKPLLSIAYRLNWNAARGRLSYMRPGSDAHYRILTMRPEMASGSR